MNKRLLHLSAWHWRGGPDNQRQALHLIAVPLFMLGALLLLSGLFNADFTQLAVGAIALVAGFGLQRQEQRL